MFAVFKKYWRPFFAGLAFAVLCFVALEAMMKPVSTSEYCGGKCHEMNTAYQSWELSAHGSNKYGIRVKCVDCHLPSKDRFFTHIAAKGYAGAKDTYKHYFGGEYDLEKQRQKVIADLPNRRCMNCHDDLLALPGTPGARIAHMVVVVQPDAPENKCVSCHEDTGHERERKLFSQ